MYQSYFLQHTFFDSLVLLDLPFWSPFNGCHVTITMTSLRLPNIRSTFSKLKKGRPSRMAALDLDLDDPNTREITAKH